MTIGSVPDEENVPGERSSPAHTPSEGPARDMARRMFADALAEVRIERRAQGMRLDGWRYEAALRAIERALADRWRMPMNAPPLAQQCVRRTDLTGYPLDVASTPEGEGSPPAEPKTEACPATACPLGPTRSLLCGEQGMEFPFARHKADDSCSA